MQKSNRPNILLVEDERSIADNIRLCLEAENFNVQWSASYQEALKMAQDSPWALLILDVGLPDGNGYSLCKEIRKSQDTPIVFLTARSDEVDKVVGFEFGADDYITKPFSPRELVLRIKAILKRGQPERNDGAALFVVDEEKQRITFNKKILELSRYEYRILKVLVARPGQIFSREKLMELAWDSPESSFDRTVDTHIKSLRAKLKEVAPKLNPIETHRGSGYSLKENLRENS
jgi:two-component system catabolic regulation response regulator CreB